MLAAITWSAVLVGFGALLAGVGSVLSGLAALKTASKAKEIEKAQSSPKEQVEGAN